MLRANLALSIADNTLWWLSQIELQIDLRQPRQKTQNHKNSVMKNYVLPKRAFLKVCTILLATAALISCSKDDDDEPNSPAPQAVSFKIALQKIVASNITENDQSIEVYGTVNSKLKRDNITEENMILSLAESEFIGVGTSDIPLSESFTYQVPEANIEASTLEIIASFTDRDPDGNDNEFLGTRSLSIPLPDITGTIEYQMAFDDDTPNVVTLTYTITRE